jgi:hypothetical protein
MPQRPSTAAARWYTRYNPSSLPSIPDDCPNPAGHRPQTKALSTGDVVPTSWLADAWTLAIGPFAVGSATDVRCPLPASPMVFELIGQARATLHAAHPELAATADAYERCHRHVGRD